MRINMRPIEVTDEQIIAAGKQLIAAERRVTGFALRQVTKSGDSKRLKKVWDDYQHTAQSGTTTEPQTDLPAEMIEVVAQVSSALVDKINKIAIELNNIAVKASERRITALVQDTNELRKQVEQELIDANVTVTNLETELDSKDIEIEQLIKRLEEANHSAQTQAVEIAQFRERLLAAETSAKNEAEHAMNQITSLTNEKQTLIAWQQALHTEIDLFKEDLADKRAELKQLQPTVQLLTDKNDAYSFEISELKSDLVETKAVLAHQNSELEKLNSQLAIKTNESQDAEQEIIAIRELLAKTSGQLELANIQNLALMAAISDERLKKSQVAESKIEDANSETAISCEVQDSIS
jgi:colicin import membrane protein